MSIAAQEASEETYIEAEYEEFRDMVREFISREVAPNFEAWEDAKRPARSLFTSAGTQGLLMFAADEKFGGMGVDDFRYNAILDEEFGRANFGSAGLSLALQNDVVGPYFLELCNESQKDRWLPGLVSGELVAAIAMTEPGTGSDLSGIRTSAVRNGDHYVVNGSKTFITNGQNADVVVVAVRTSEDRHRGLSLLVLERNMLGFERGRNLDKIGLHGQDTSELSFSDVEVPVENLLGEEGQGFFYLVRNLPTERLSLAITAVGACEGAFQRTLGYVKERHAFGQPIGSFQNSRFEMAEMATEIDIARTYVDACLTQLVDKSLTPARAAKAKWWTTELQQRVVTRCLQLYGGYGYMKEYDISRAFLDARIQTIYGGTTEIMKEIIGRDLGL